MMNSSEIGVAVIRVLSLPPLPASTSLPTDQKGEIHGSHGSHTETDRWATPAPLGAPGLRAEEGWQEGKDGKKQGCPTVTGRHLRRL